VKNNIEDKDRIIKMFEKWLANLKNSLADAKKRKSSKDIAKHERYIKSLKNSIKRIEKAKKKLIEDYRIKILKYGRFYYKNVKKYRNLKRIENAFKKASEKVHVLKYYKEFKSDKIF
jgi:DNA repair exonuclease SbcCD ATPase subunit